jgi:type IV pilus assembly protein PilC
MASYLYRARDTAGSQREGALRAATLTEAIEALHQRDLTPTWIEASGAQRRGRRVVRQGRVKSAELAALCWQLSTLIEGGIPITTGLEIAAGDTANPQLKTVLHRTLVSVSEGRPFSDGLKEFPQVFKRIAVAIVVAGETGGNLGHALHTLAEHYESKDRLAKKIKAAMAYPLFVLVLITTIIVAIMVFVVPRFRAIFSQLGGRLPAFTVAFMRFHGLLWENAIPLIMGVAVVTGGGIALSRTRAGHQWISRILLRLPLFGRLSSEVFAASFCTTAATLLEAGVPVLDVFEILRGMSSNDVLCSAVARAKARITEGASMAASMAAVGVFPNMVVKMTQVGEESGFLPVVLRKTSDHYERRINATIDTATSLLGPVMIVLIGAIVLVTVIALYLPLFAMSDTPK